jgi:hypothetical protein
MDPRTRAVKTYQLGSNRPPSFEPHRLAKGNRSIRTRSDLGGATTARSPGDSFGPALRGVPCPTS